MDLNHVLLWLVVISSVSIILRMLPLWRQYRDWLAVFLLILAATAAAFFLWPQGGGLVGGALWLVWFILPWSGIRLVSRFMAQQRYKRAYHLARLLRWLHPTYSWRQQPTLIRALELHHQGSTQAASAILRQYQSAGNTLSHDATAQLYQMEQRWEEMRDWIRQEIGLEGLQREPNIVLNYLRALGETGDLDELVYAFNYFEKSIARAGLPAKQIARLLLFVFCGHQDLVAQLFQGPLALYPQPAQEFWLATAEQAAGSPETARPRLERILESPPTATHRAARNRLERPVRTAAQVLTPEAWAALELAEKEWDEEKRFSSQPVRGRRPYVTYALIGANLIAFTAEVSLGGSMDSYTLYRLGGLLPTAVLAGEWWRLLTHTFLHLGWLHLVLNLLGLYIVGPFVEFSLGLGRTLLIYLGSGVGAGLFIVLLTRSGPGASQLLVGASGCIMGLIGANGAILLRAWRMEGAHIAARRLSSVVLIIVIQVAFDLLTPQVSLVGHLAGAALGFLLAGLALLEKRPVTY